MLDYWYGRDEISFCNCSVLQSASCSQGYHSVSMISFNPDNGRTAASELPAGSGEIIWRQGEKSNRIIFRSRITFLDGNGSRTVDLTIMADTGATCSVFNRKFVENNAIPWRRREKPLRITL